MQTTPAITINADGSITQEGEGRTPIEGEEQNVVIQNKPVTPVSADGDAPVKSTGNQSNLKNDPKKMK